MSVFEELQGYLIPLLLLVLCSVGLNGCVSYVSPNPAEQLPDRSGSILQERLNRDMVRSRFGGPLITSRYWGIDLFREGRSQIEMPVGVIFPFMFEKDDIYRYTMVSYDKDSIAASSASGIHRRPSAFRMTSPIAYNDLSLRLRSGDFTFVVEWEDRYETLLAAPVRRDPYLAEARLSDRCTIVIGCGTGECPEKLTLDEGPTLPLPCRLKVRDFDDNALALLRQGKQDEYERVYPITVYDAVAALSLTPGTHTIKAWGGRWHRGKFYGRFSGEQSADFSCSAGEIIYGVIDVSAKDYSWWGAKDVVRKIDLQKEMPAFFTDRHLVIYRGDRWLADPGRNDKLQPLH